MASGVMFVNDFDTSTLGLAVLNVLGADDAAMLTPRTREVYGRVGVIQTTPQPKVGTRTITVTGTVRGTSPATMLTNIDALKALFLAQAYVRFLYPADRHWLVYLSELTLAPLSGPQYLNVAVGVALKLLALDPLGYGVSLSAASIGASPLPVSLGTAPSTPLLTLSGGTNPVVTLRDAAGNAVQALGFTVTLGATERLVVDCSAMTIVKYTGATPADALSTLASGDFLVLDPADGVPTVEVNSGIGELLYRKAWR